LYSPASSRAEKPHKALIEITFRRRPQAADENKQVTKNKGEHRKNLCTVVGWDTPL
jgi:hypothetical protein